MIYSLSVNFGSSRSLECLLYRSLPNIDLKGRKGGLALGESQSKTS
jgi:hypothetical protein